LVRERWLRFKTLLEFADDELRRTNPELCVRAACLRRSFAACRCRSSLAVHAKSSPN
jgi:hypothetical protein